MKYNGKNLEEVLKAHGVWLMDPLIINDRQDDSISRADLSGADLRKADLCGADLRVSDLHGANLYRADLHVVNLSGANLIKANLRKADLCDADLRRADLRGADLSGSDLHGANLYRADLRGANLYRADLRGAYLRKIDLINADLRGADLSGAYLREIDLINADLRGADLSGAVLREVKNIPHIPMACPDSGSFIGWKVCNANGCKVIVKLLIPEDAKRSSGTGRKCRCDKAVVLEIQTMEGELLDGVEAYSIFDKSFIYEVGKIVTPTNSFCEERFDECSSGIHFFINRQEAVDYNNI